ncbi:lanthionine synthetase LanC family protein [Microbacterium sp. NPDC055910]|uniref:class III lanthionine synthetase LanKC N-terminal domain-containing protein n=1 Tax=Microbacterium sp. NPDC055910 TaxID=3345659 RepID=UPI0035DF0150
MPGAPAPSDEIEVAPRPSVITTLEAAVRRASDRWSLAHADDWIRVSSNTSVPEQGWKIHLSASPLTADAVLESALPVLLSHDCAFKVLRSHELLGILNQGHGENFSQVGKFITVYPPSDDGFVTLAREVDAATSHLHGPVISSDRPVRPGSIVYYRYGSFRARWLQTPLGEYLPALLGPDGVPVPDERGSRFSRPDWVSDPLATLEGDDDDVSGDRDSGDSPALVAGRFVVVGAPLHTSARGAVHLALDLHTRQTVVLKHARRGGVIESSGLDARDRLRHESNILTQLADDSRIPRQYGLFEFKDDLFLALEDIPGSTITRAVSDRYETGAEYDEDWVVGIASELASLVAGIHERGLVLHDLKSSNVILGNDDRPRLIDFELAAPVGYAAPDRRGYGTPGYMAPQQRDGESSSVADDVFSFGALLYFLTTGAEPSQAPDVNDLLARRPLLMNPRMHPLLAQLIERCLRSDRASRPATMHDISKALDSLRHDVANATAAHRDTANDGQTAQQHAMRRARELFSAMDATVHRDGDRTFWRTRHPQARGFDAGDINIGGAGAVLAYAELVDACDGDEEARDVLRRTALSLRYAPVADGAPLAGLYVGLAGRGAAILRAGQVLDDLGLIAIAEEISDDVARMPGTAPDLFNGLAGRVRFHLLVHQVVGGSRHLQHAEFAGTRLLDDAKPDEHGRLSWSLADGFGKLAGPIGTGYAHGYAGIGDVLIDLHNATGGERWRETASQIAERLESLAVTTPSQGTRWPDHADGSGVMTGSWCHGGAGIAIFFRSAGKAGIGARSLELLGRAARTVASSGRHLGPAQCHGHAATIELLLDAYQSTKNENYLTEAAAVGRLLDAYASATEHGVLYFGDTPNVTSPDYMLGYAGIAMTLLRLAEPDTRPRQLSLNGFSHRAPAH